MQEGYYQPTRPLSYFLHVLIIVQANCFILQLPNCGRYNGNFTETHINKYFTSNVTKTVTNVSMRKCSLHCTLHIGCLFFNHKLDQSVCQLLSSHKGILIQKPGWQFVSTSYKNVHLRGPVCRYLGEDICTHHDDKGSHCIDTCAAPGFQCQKDDNIALMKPVRASSESTMSGVLRTADSAVDGKGSFWASKDGPDPWLLIDLLHRRFVAYFLWSHIGDWGKVAYYYMMKPLLIRIGDSDESDLNGNHICADNLDLSGKQKNVVYCVDGPMWGRYVVLQKRPTPGNKRFFVGELHVFVLA